jgi:hypothetical protein
MRLARDIALGCLFMAFLFVPGAMAHAMVPYDMGWIGEVIVWIATIGPFAILTLVAVWPSPFFRPKGDR